VDEVRTVFEEYSPISVTPNYRNDGELTSYTLILPKGSTNLSSLLRRRRNSHPRRLIFSNGTPVIFKKKSLQENLEYRQSESEFGDEDDDAEKGEEGALNNNLDLVLHGFMSRHLGSSS
jgi:hypothetical protein